MNRWAPVLLPAVLLAACVPVSGGTADGGGGGTGGAGGCPAIACGPSYEVRFARVGVWTPGTYTVEVTADGVPSSCEVDIPMSCDRGPRCTGAQNWWLRLSGCALEEGQQKLDGITFDFVAPTAVVVHVTRDGKALGSRTFTPSYVTGIITPGCSLVCRQARDELAIP